MLAEFVSKQIIEQEDLTKISSAIFEYQEQLSGRKTNTVQWCFIKSLAVI